MRFGLATKIGDLYGRAVGSWEKFWFTPVETSTLAIVRIAYGLLTLFFTISLGTDLKAFFSEAGLVPEPPFYGVRVLGVLSIWPSDIAIYVLWVVLLVACVCLLVGYHTRLAAVVVFVAILSFQRRNPFLFNSGDGLVRVIGLYLMFAPMGVALSVDRWRKAKDHFWEFPKRAPWALRLIQIQVSVIYISTVWAKLRGVTWNDGTAASYAMRLWDLERFPVPTFITDNVIIINFITYSTLAIEIAIGFLVWNRRARPWVLWFGVLLHLSIDLTLTVAFFSWAVFVTYLAFIPEDTATRLLLRVRDRLKRSKIGALRRLGALERPAPEVAPVAAAYGD